MGDWRAPKWIYFDPLPTPAKTLVRRVLLFSETMRVVLSYPPKVAFNESGYHGIHTTKLRQYTWQRGPTSDREHKTQADTTSS